MSSGFPLLIFGILYFILFSLPLALVLNRNSDNRRLFIALIGAVLLNNFAFLSIGTEVIANIPSGNYMKGLIPLIAATVNGMLYFRFYTEDNNGIIRKILTGLIILFIALIFPIQFSSPSIILSMYRMLRSHTQSRICASPQSTTRSRSSRDSRNHHIRDSDTIHRVFRT